jgi:acetylornithine/LysW-gamma-L-lysine aminotransferase
MNVPKTNAEIVELESRYTSGVYNLRSVALVRGEGAHLWDADGRQYIDCVGGHGVVNVGHCNPEVAQAICDQARTLITCPTSFPNDKRAMLVAELIRIAPFKAARAFLCNSGTESIEAALKFARLATGRKGYIAAKNAFHGRTFGSLSATWNAEYRKPFEPLVPGFTHVAYNDAAALEQAMNDDTAAVILEIVQGEGGVRPGDGEYLRRAQALCRERGALLIIDEVQTGFGRTGKMFACEHYGIEPDLMCVAKSIAGGLPMGAVLIGERLGELASQSHGTTFGGNPITCAAALAVIHYIEANKLPERAAELGEYFMGQLRQIKSPLIREVRGLGLMIGLELKQRSAPFIAQLIERGVLTLAAGPIVIRFLPPLVIGKSDIDNVLEAVTDVLTVQK